MKINKMENLVSNSNLLVLQLLSLVDNGCIVNINEMLEQVNEQGLEKYLIETCNTELTVNNKDYFDVVSKNLINFWNCYDSEKFGIKNNGLIYLIISLIELSRSGYRNDL